MDDMEHPLLDLYYESNIVIRDEELRKELICLDDNNTETMGTMHDDQGSQSIAKIFNMRPI